MRIIFASHGDLAKAMVGSAQMIAGGTSDIDAIGFYEGEGFDDFKDEVESMIQSACNEELLVLTDLFYGSPFNAVTQLMGKYRFAHITGVNLAVILEVVLAKDECASVWELKARVMESARDSLIDVNEQLEKMGD